MLCFTLYKKYSTRIDVVTNIVTGNLGTPVCNRLDKQAKKKSLKGSSHYLSINASGLPV